MSEISQTSASRLSSRLIHGSVDDELLREIAALKDIPAGLANNMLMILSDTDDARMRNILAATLARAGVTAAVPRLVHLIRETKTAGARGTLLYALQQLHANLDIVTLTQLILTDTSEAKEEALILLEEALDDGAPASEIEQAIYLITRYYPLNYTMPSIVNDTKEILREALAASSPL